MSGEISASVGKGGTNRQQDVVIVQELLNKIPAEQGGPDPRLVVDGILGPKTINAIEQFQRIALGFNWPDGRVDVGGKTIIKLLEIEQSLLSPPDGSIGDTESTFSDSMQSSVLDADSPGAMRGEIFFDQREATLDDENDGRRALIRQEFKKYGDAMKTARERRDGVSLSFAFIGFASPEDIRPGPDGLKSNKDLAEVRATKVADYAKSELLDAGVRLEELIFHIIGYGEDPAGQGKPQEMWPLYRRVTVLGPPADANAIAIDIPDPWTPRPLNPVCALTNWEMRLTGGLTLPVPVKFPGITLTGGGVGIEIRDPSGVINGGKAKSLILAGPGAATGKLPKLASATAWTTVRSPQPLCWDDFKGPAQYNALFSPFRTIQVIQFLGPIGAGSIPIFAWWVSSTVDRPRRESIDGWVFE